MNETKEEEIARIEREVEEEASWKRVVWTERVCLVVMVTAVAMTIGVFLI